MSFNLRDCVESALDPVAMTAARKELDLAYFIEPSVPASLVTDATRLRQVLLNLINNAVKCTEKGEVVLTSATDPRAVAANGDCRLLCSVRDTGIENPRDRKAALFVSFKQVDAATTRRCGGIGLGQAIPRHLWL